MSPRRLHAVQDVLLPDHRARGDLAPVDDQLTVPDGELGAVGDDVHHVGTRGVDHHDPGVGQTDGATVGVAPRDERRGVHHRGHTAGGHRLTPTRSRSMWSITAISPGWSRLARSFVRRPTRAVPVTVTDGASLSSSRTSRPRQRRGRGCGRVLGHGGVGGPDRAVDRGTIVVHGPLNPRCGDAQPGRSPAAAALARSRG